MGRNDDTRFFSLKITLKGTNPAVWRRVLVPADGTLAYLHAVIQEAMGWENGHLYDFIVGTGRGESILALSETEDDSIFEEVAVSSIFKKAKSKAKYIYDFGDGWQHDIVFEKEVELKPGQKVPLCTAGKGACPPEDSGGLYGYYMKLEALADPDDEGHAETVEWMGKNFDPGYFDLNEANQRLASLR